MTNMTRTYVVCNKPLRSDGTLYCEFDGEVGVEDNGWYRCPACGYVRWVS